VVLAATIGMAQVSVFLLELMLQDIQRTPTAVSRSSRYRDPNSPMTTGNVLHLPAAVQKPLPCSQCDEHLQDACTADVTTYGTQVPTQSLRCMWHSTQEALDMHLPPRTQHSQRHHTRM
jgi:hypothetical protein